MDLTGELVLVVTTDLVVRSRPGTGSDSRIYWGRLNAPDLVYVIAGPEHADGYEWYLVDPVRPPCGLGCDFEPQPGWVAAAGMDGERWLGQRPERPTCPAAPTIDDLVSMLEELRLYCYRGQELTLTGYVGGESVEVGAEWPWEYVDWLYPSDHSPPPPGCADCASPSLKLAYDSDNGAPYPPGEARIAGHFDDLLAERCEPISTDFDARLSVHDCRLLFVVTRWR